MPGRRALAAAFVLALVLVAGCLRPTPPERPVAHPFAVTTLDGTPFVLADHRGEVVLLDFMATWCVPCRTQIPEFAAVREALAPRGLVVLSIDVDPTEDSATLAAFRDEVDPTWPFALDTAGLTVYYDAVALPKQVLVDADGRIAWATRPGQVVGGDRLAREVERLL